MRLLIITQYYWPENFRINDLTTDLIGRGHQVTVLTGVPNYPSGSVFAEYKASPKSFMNFSGAEIIRVPIVPRGNNSIQLALNFVSFILSASTIGLYRLRKQQYDAVFVFEPSPVTVCLPAVLYRRLKQVPVAFWVLDLWPDTLKAIGIVRSERLLKMIGRVVSFIYNRNDLILGQSKSFVPHIKSYCNHENVRYFPGWAESVFSGDQSQPIKKKETSSLFNVVFTGNVGESQDFPAVLNAAEILKDEDGIRFTIVGDGRMSQWVAEEVNKRGLSERVILEGRHPIEKMPYFFSQADALLVCLKDESIFSYTIPGKLQAYLMAGKPIVAMLNGEGAELVRSNHCGISCAAGDAKGLATAILQLSQMTIEQREAMGRACLHLSETEFDRIKLIGRLETWLFQLSKKESLVP